MRVILDECLDWRLRRDLPAHEVKTVQEMGWNGITNGRLLALAQGAFQVFITGDRNLSFQQNLSDFSIAVLVLKAESIRLIHTPAHAQGASHFADAPIGSTCHHYLLNWCGRPSHTCRRLRTFDVTETIRSIRTKQETCDHRRSMVKLEA